MRGSSGALIQVLSSALKWRFAHGNDVQGGLRSTHVFLDCVWLVTGPDGTVVFGAGSQLLSAEPCAFSLTARVRGSTTFRSVSVLRRQADVPSATSGLAPRG